MNAAYLQQIQNALNQAVNIIGSQFIYNGNIYNGVINAVEISNELEAGGLVQSLANEIIVPKSAMPTAPVIGAKVTVNGQLERIEKVYSDEISYTLICITATK